MKKQTADADAYLVQAANKCLAFVYFDLQQASQTAQRLGGGKAEVFPLFRGKPIKQRQQP